MNSKIIDSTYRRLAPLYDAIFGFVLQPGRKRSVQSLHCKKGERVLEVGVGTGLSLSLYPRNVQVIGIDLCPDMLERARSRVDLLCLDNVQALLRMDGRNMSFSPECFDKVVAMYVMPALDDPQQLVREMRRVCKPGGELVFINHFQSNRLLVRLVEGLFSPLWRWVKYRSDLKLEEFLSDAGLEVMEIQHANIFGYATMIRCINESYPESPAEVMTEFMGELLTDEGI